VKGFAATPIIFIAVFLITVLLFVHFMDIDKQVAEGVGKEARMRKLQADALKNQTVSSNELFSCALSWARQAQNKNDLESGISSCLNGTVVTVSSYTNGFMASYDMEYKSSTLIDASLNKTITVSERLEYPFFELTNAADNFAGTFSGTSCDIASNYDGEKCTEPWPAISGVEWCGKVTRTKYGCTVNTTICKLDYNVAGSRMPSYALATTYWHYVGKSFTGLSCKD